MLIPFTYNMLRRHPALKTMIHRSEEVAGAEAGKAYRRGGVPGEYFWDVS